MFILNNKQNHLKNLTVTVAFTQRSAEKSIKQELNVLQLLGIQIVKRTRGREGRVSRFPSNQKKELHENLKVKSNSDDKRQNSLFLGKKEKENRILRQKKSVKTDSNSELFK